MVRREALEFTLHNPAPESLTARLVITRGGKLAAPGMALSRYASPSRGAVYAVEPNETGRDLGFGCSLKIQTGSLSPSGFRDDRAVLAGMTKTIRSE